MIIGFLKENDENETRSMLLPEHVSQISKIGLKVLVEANYSEKLNIKDALYSEGAEIKSANDISLISDIIVKISGKDLDTYSFKNGSIIIMGFFDKSNEELLKIKMKKI